MAEDLPNQQKPPIKADDIKSPPENSEAEIEKLESKIERLLEIDQLKKDGLITTEEAAHLVQGYSTVLPKNTNNPPKEGLSREFRTKLADTIQKLFGEKNTGVGDEGKEVERKDRLEFLREMINEYVRDGKISYQEGQDLFFGVPPTPPQKAEKDATTNTI